MAARLEAWMDGVSVDIFGCAQKLLDHRSFTITDSIVFGGRRLGEKGGFHGLRAIYRIPVS
jgi:hypothetical protein